MTKHPTPFELKQTISRPLIIFVLRSTRDKLGLNNEISDEQLENVGDYIAKNCTIKNCTKAKDIIEKQFANIPKKQLVMLISTVYSLFIASAVGINIYLALKMFQKKYDNSSLKEKWRVYLAARTRLFLSEEDMAPKELEDAFKRYCASLKSILGHTHFKNYYLSIAMVKVSLGTITLSILSYATFGATILSIIGGVAGIVFLGLGIRMWCNSSIGEDGTTVGSPSYDGPTLDEISKDLDEIAERYNHLQEKKRIIDECKNEMNSNGYQWYNFNALYNLQSMLGRRRREMDTIEDNPAKRKKLV